MNELNKVVRLGKSRDGDVFCKIEIENGRLSISGVVGPMRGGDAWGGCGQIVGEKITEYAPGWSAELVAKFYQTWERWHLNDMRAGCEHQREWDIAKKVVVQRWSWGDNYHALRRSVTESKDTKEICPLAQELAKANAIFDKMDLHGYTTTGRHAWPEGAEDLLTKGFIKPDKTEDKAVGWVYPNEHPEGVMCKPCPVCGYKYGSAWLKEEVPSDVIEFLSNLPDADKTPAWV